MEISVVIADPPAASMFLVIWCDDWGRHRAIMHPPPPEPVIFAPCAPPLRAITESLDKEMKMRQSLGLLPFVSTRRS